jgi:hypothetical protein
MAGRTAHHLRLPIAVDAAALPAVYLTLAILAYLLFSFTMYRPHVTGAAAAGPYLLAAILALGGIPLSYRRATRAYRVLVRSIIAFAVFYVAASHVRIDDALIGGDRLADFELNGLWILAVLGGVAGFFRPSLGLVPLLYIPWQKQQLMHVGGIPIEWMDYVTMIETGCFLIVGYLIFGLICRVAPSFAADGRASPAKPSPLTGTLHPVDGLVLLAVAFHFGNYLYAGLIKTTLGDGPLYWVLHNRTELLVLAAWDQGVLPVSFSKQLAGFTYESLATLRVFTNLATIAIQLFAVVALFRMRWAILTTLSYDLLHVVIFVTTGIFFWKFIILNLAIVAALSSMRISSVPRNSKIALAAAVVCSPYVFHILGSFAWIDTPSVNQVRFYAVTEEGTEHGVPSNYFLGASVTLAQNRMVWPAQGPFPTETWGTTRDFAVAQHGLSCNWAREASEMPPAVFSAAKPAIQEAVRRNHRQILSMADANGFVEYDLLPHHIFSMPWEFRNFKALDKRRIRSYRYELEAVCLGYEDGRITRKLMYRATFGIPLR